MNKIALKILLLSTITSILFCTSCSSVKYVKMIDNNISPRFERGRWLINSINAKVPDEVKLHLRNTFVYNMKDVRGFTPLSIDSIPKKYSSKIKQSYKLTKEELSIPELTHKFDYIVNINIDFNGQSYESTQEYNCQHTETHYSGNRSYSTTTNHTKELSEGHLDINTIVEVIVYDISTKEICYKQGIASDYTFIPTHATTCESESLTANLVFGIFDAIISTAPNRNSKVEHILNKSCRKIAKEIKRCQK